MSGFASDPHSYVYIVQSQLLANFVKTIQGQGQTTYISAINGVRSAAVVNFFCYDRLAVVHSDVAVPF